MSDICYPDSLIGSVPNLYYYAANNPSEATIAKRRSYANTISYLTPPAENAGLYKGLKVLPAVTYGCPCTAFSLRSSRASCYSASPLPAMCDLDKGCAPGRCTTANMKSIGVGCSSLAAASALAAKRVSMQWSPRCLCLTGNVALGRRS